MYTIRKYTSNREIILTHTLNFLNKDPSFSTTTPYNAYGTTAHPPPPQPQPSAANAPQPQHHPSQSSHPYDDYSGSYSSSLQQQQQQQH